MRDELGRLRDANPVPNEAVRGAARSPHAGETLERILEEDELRRRPSRRAWALVAAAALLAVMVVALSVFFGGAEDEGPAPVNRLLPPSRVLPAAAATALSLPSVALNDGQYVYTRMRTTYPITSNQEWSVLLSRTREVWMAADGSGRVRESAAQVSFPGPDDEAGWIAEGRPDLTYRASGRDAPPGELFPAWMQGLSADPATLARQIERIAPSRHQSIGAIGDALAMPLLAPEVRSALFRHLLGMRGIMTVQPLAGSPPGSVTVAVDTHYAGGIRRFSLTFDPGTSALISEERQLGERAPWFDAAPGFTYSSEVIVVSGVVESIGATVSA